MQQYQSNIPKVGGNWAQVDKAAKPAKNANKPDALNPAIKGVIDAGMNLGGAKTKAAEQYANKLESGIEGIAAQRKTVGAGVKSIVDGAMGIG